MLTTTVTAKVQVAIPASLRKELFIQLPSYGSAQISVPPRFHRSRMMYRIKHRFRVSGNYLKEPASGASGLAPSLLPTFKRPFADS